MEENRLKYIIMQLANNPAPSDTHTNKSLIEYLKSRIDLSDKELEETEFFLADILELINEDNNEEEKTPIISSDKLMDIIAVFISDSANATNIEDNREKYYHWLTETIGITSEELVEIYSNIDKDKYPLPLWVAERMEITNNKEVEQDNIEEERE